MAMALVPAVLTLNVSPCSFSVAVDTHAYHRHRHQQFKDRQPLRPGCRGCILDAGGVFCGKGRSKRLLHE